MSRSLEELLRDADESAHPPPSPAQLAGRVRARSHAAARRRRAAGVAALLFSIGIASAIATRSTRPDDTRRVANTTPVTKPATTERTRDAAEALQADAAVTMSVVNELRAREQRRSRVTRVRVRPPGEAGAASIASELDRAALTMLDHGDRLRRDLKQIDAALAAYRRTIELFPETRWAAVAKQRIEQLAPDARGAGAGSEPSFS